jgi:hypothetical protein
MAIALTKMVDARGERWPAKPRNRKVSEMRSDLPTRIFR